MQGVTPLAEQNLADIQKPRLPKTNLSELRQAAVSQAPSLLNLGLSDGQVVAIEPGASLSFYVPDLPRRTWQTLKQGRIEWQEGLDLHGFTVENSRVALKEFIQDSRSKKFRCVLLVHGKSYNHAGEVPSIKSHVNAWLRQLPEVLAFCSALPKDGGTGAVYVLLRTRA